MPPAPPAPPAATPPSREPPSPPPSIGSAPPLPGAPPEPQSHGPHSAPSERHRCPPEQAAGPTHVRVSPGAQTLVGSFPPLRPDETGSVEPPHATTGASSKYAQRRAREPIGE